MTAARVVVAGLLLLAALVLQASALPLLTGSAGVVPNLCLLVVVAVALTTSELSGAATGFAAGLALDLAPPADHLAGRWALALLLAGWLAGRLASPRTPAHTTSRVAELAWWVVVAAAASLVATSVFALTGLVFGELSWGVADLLRGLGVALLVDVLAAVLVIPATLRLLDPLSDLDPAPDRAPAG